MNQRFTKIVGDARAGIVETSVTKLKQQLDEKQDIHLIDVHEDREWDTGHILGAQHIGRGVLERDIESAVPQTNAEIILYCGSGQRSALAAQALQKMGYTNTKSLNGGYRAWKEMGYPVEYRPIHGRVSPLRGRPREPSSARGTILGRGPTHPHCAIIQAFEKSRARRSISRIQ